MVLLISLAAFCQSIWRRGALRRRVLLCYTGNVTHDIIGTGPAREGWLPSFLGGDAGGGHLADIA